MELIINQKDRIELTSCKRETCCNNGVFQDRTVCYFPGPLYNEENLTMLKGYMRGVYEGSLHLQVVSVDDVDGQPHDNVLKEFFNVPPFLCVELIFFTGMLPDDEPFFMASIDEIIF
jgi:hypothetical protein